MENKGTQKVEDYTETHKLERASKSDDQLREIGWKQCTSCMEMRPPELYYKSNKHGTSSYTCKICHRDKMSSYKNIEGSYAWYYRRYDNIKRRAIRKGIEFNLTVEDIRRIKDAEFCTYCGQTTEFMTFDRIDNDLGYTVENIRAACYLCNKIKSNLPFNEEEMKLIGKGIAVFCKRTGADNSSYKYGEDADKIKEIIDG